MHPTHRRAGTWPTRSWVVFQILDVARIHQQDLPGFLDVDHPLEFMLGGHDGGHTGLRVIVAIDGHAARGDHFHRLASRLP